MPIPLPAALADLRFSLRQLRKTPVFTAIAILTLALGIGANSAVFSVMDAVLLRALPVREPDGLFYVRMAQGQQQPGDAGNTGDGNTSFSMPVFTALRARNDVFRGLIAYAPMGIPNTSARVGSNPLQAEGEEVSGNFFSTLSANLALGRALTPADEQQHTANMVVSYSFWTREFAASPRALGATVHVKGVPFTVVGIAARGFVGVEPATSTDFWVPFQTRPELPIWGSTGEYTLYGTPKWWCLRMMARLQPGVTPEGAQAALAGTFLHAAQNGVGIINTKTWKPLLTFDPAQGVQGYSDLYREPITILMGLVLLILLIAVTNVALMLVARNAARSREFSLRLAIGATRVRLFRQLLVESALLVGAGAALGWLFAMQATALLAHMSQIDTGLSPNRTVLWFTVIVSVLAALTFGLAPLRAATRVPIADVLRASGTTSTEGRRKVAMGNVVMAAQVAVCLLLLVSAGLLLRTLSRYGHQPLGMDANHLLIFSITPPGADTPAQAKILYDTLRTRLDAIPGVAGTTFAAMRPGSGWSNNNTFALDGVDKRGTGVRINTVGTGYFHTVGTPLLAGRDLSEADASSKAAVVVVNQSFANRWFPQSNPLGHHLKFYGADQTIIGVVADSRYASVDEPPFSMAYDNVWREPQNGKLTVEVRAKGDPLALLPAVREAVRAVNPDLPLEDPMTQAQQFQLSYAQPAMFATLGGFFGGLAALLVAAGLYGTLAYRTARRRTEIGIRMALGARRGQVAFLVLRESLLLLVLGLAAGLPLTWLATRGLKSLLWELSPGDPWSFAMGVLGTVLVIAAASFLPALRAASIDPAKAVRAE